MSWECPTTFLLGIRVKLLRYVGISVNVMDTTEDIFDERNVDEKLDTIKTCLLKQYYLEINISIIFYSCTM